MADRTVRAHPPDGQALVLGALVGTSVGPVASLEASTVQGTAVQISGLDDLAATADQQARKEFSDLVYAVINPSGLADRIGKAGHVAQAWLLRLALAALRREAAIVRSHLADEVLRGTVTPAEYVLVQHAALRGSSERQLLATAGLRAYLTLRALHQAVIGLAFRHWHVRLGAAAKSGSVQPEDAYRVRIAQLRRSLTRQTQQSALAPTANKA